jgi:nucleoside-diphosphate-sugar epimerase
MPRRALLLAGNGFIGSRTALRLADSGADVAIHHTGRRPAPPSCVGIVASRTDPPIVEFPAAAAGFGAHAAIHFLCMGAEDAHAFVDAFDGVVGRLVLISSCDVYRAYGRFVRLESGPADPTPLGESAPLRASRHPYRATAPDKAHLNYWYEKLEAERTVASVRKSEFVILRLPKVYGPGGTERLDTIYAFADQPHWRWTHGHVDNVAEAISVAAFHPRAAGEIFNIGEGETPTMGERLMHLPSRPPVPRPHDKYDFTQSLHFETTRIRTLLDYRDVIDEREAMAALAAASAACDSAP